MNRFLVWTPRIIAGLFIIFISLFALDSFNATQTLTQSIIAFSIHLIPSYVLLIALLIAWKHARTGGIIFLGLGILFIVWLGINKHWINILSLNVPFFLIGILFLVSGLIQNKTALTDQKH
jgi:hypothetical protein